MQREFPVFGKDPPMPRPRIESELSISQLEQILASRRQAVAKLERERIKYEQKLAQINSQIRELGGEDRHDSGRVRNTRGLNDTIAQVLADNDAGPMRVADIVQAVLETGYRSNSANFRGIVNQSLIKDKRFVTATRGAYQLKKQDKGRDERD